MIERDNISCPIFQTIVSDARKAFITDSMVITQFPGQINVMNHQGNIKQQITFSESEGYISNLYIVNQTLFAYTQKNQIKLFDLSRREVKQIGMSRKFLDNQGQPLGDIIHAQCNKVGNRILLINKDKKSYLYDVSLDTIVFVSDDSLGGTWDKGDERFFVL